MSKPSNRIANILAAALILPFAAGLVHAADTAKKPSEDDKEQVTAPEKAVPPPTIDSNDDAKPDAWDRDGNGKPDAWDINDDGKPDLFDDNGDGRPDEQERSAKPAAPPVEPGNDEPR